MGPHSTPIEDLPDNEISSKVIDELKDIASDSDDQESEGDDNPLDVSSNSIYKDIIKKVMKNGLDSFIVFLLFMVFSNGTVNKLLFDLPFLVTYADGGIIANVIIASIASVLFFVLKYFLK
jgi:hypothetical protein